MVKINPSKKLLVWKSQIKKPLTEQQRQEFGMNDSGISYIKNMSEIDANKWIATLFPQARRIEIQKTISGIALKIVISDAKNHPKISDWDRSWLKTYKGFIISLGQNGTSLWKIEEIEELYQAIQEAMDVIRNLK